LAARKSALLDALSDIFEIVVAWRPGATRPVTIIYLRIDDMVLIHDRTYVDSPAVASVPPNKVGTPVTVSWAIAPEVDVDEIAIGFARRGRSGTTPIASKKDVARGDVWQDEKRLTIQ